MVAQEAASHATFDQLAFDQLAFDQLAFDQLAFDQLAFDQLASVCATSCQAAASKTGSGPPAGSATTNGARAAFAFGGADTSAAASASSSPTPSDHGTAAGVPCAETMSAPLTWSGVQPGLIASKSAAAPATTGAANEVPESWK